MNRLRPFLLFLMVATASAQTVATPPSLVLTHVTVVDTTGGPLQSDMTVVIRDGRIAGMEKSQKPEAGIRKKDVVDGHGKFLIPGLWDMHVHLSWTTASALPVLVANGVTGVRDMGGRLGEIDDWRTRIAAGLLVGPRIVRAGPILNGKSFNPLQMVAGTPDETRGVVRALKQVGVDFIKIHRRLPRDSYFALIDEAKKHGITVAGHIPMTVTPEEASEAGQVTLEHTETLFEGTFSAALKQEQWAGAIRQFRANDADKLFAQFVKNNTMVTPTLVAYDSIIEASDPSMPPDPRSRYVALSLQEAAKKRATPVSAKELSDLKEMFAELREVVRQMNRAGVTLMAGSDIAGPRIPGFSLHGELAWLVECGLTPLQALQAATLTPARLLDRAEDLGSVEAGKLADLVLLDANPLEDIRNTQRIAAVIVDGKLLRRADLDALLRQGQQMARQN